MWVLIKSGNNCALDEDALAWGFTDYDAAFDFMEKEIANEAKENGIDEDEYGADYDGGRGFCGLYNTSAYRIFGVELQ